MQERRKDDEPGVREIAHDILVDLGCCVMTATGGAEALKLLEQRPGVEILLTDVRMPEMTGIDLAAQAQRLYPKLRVIYMSGYTEPEVPAGSHFVSSRSVLANCNRL